MPQRQFANQKALVAYAERNGLAYLWEGAPSFAKRQRLLSPEQYEIVEVRTNRGVRPAMLFPKAILKSEWAADAPLREAMAIKRERLRALRVKRAAEPLDVLDGELGKRPFIAGDSYTIAEISIFAYSHVAADGEFDLSARANLTEWFDRVRAEPGFRNEVFPYSTDPYSTKSFFLPSDHFSPTCPQRDRMTARLRRGGSIGRVAVAVAAARVE